MSFNGHTAGIDLIVLPKEIGVRHLSHLAIITITKAPALTATATRPKVITESADDAPSALFKQRHGKDQRRQS